jgi:hypothetical protein
VVSRDFVFALTSCVFTAGDEAVAASNDVVASRYVDFDGSDVLIDARDFVVTPRDCGLSLRHVDFTFGH